MSLLWIVEVSVMQSMILTSQQVRLSAPEYCILSMSKIIQQITVNVKDRFLNIRLIIIKYPVSYLRV